VAKVDDILNHKRHKSGTKGSFFCAFCGSKKCLKKQNFIKVVVHILYAYVKFLSFLCGLKNLNPQPD